MTALIETSPLLSDTKALETVKFSILLNEIAAAALISAFTIFVIVLLSESIDLFVSVSDVSCKTIVPVAFGKDIVLSAVGSIGDKVVS
mgnify:CR=1 FL=1